MSLNIEGVVDGGVSGQKSLSRSRRLEPLHSSFALSNWQVGVFGPIVISAAEIMMPGKPEFLQSGSILREFVGNKGIRYKALALQQFAHQIERCLPVSPRLNEDIQDFALTVHGTPKIHAFAVDGHEHFVHVPPIIRSAMRLLQSQRIGLPEFQSPAPSRFVRHINAAFCQEVFDIAKAQGKPKMQPDGMLDDLRQETMASIGDIQHAWTILDRQHHGHPVNVTTPFRLAEAHTA